jgi:hypothetical protein
MEIAPFVRKATIHLYPMNGDQAMVFPDVARWMHFDNDAVIEFTARDGSEITSSLRWFVVYDPIPESQKAGA